MDSVLAWRWIQSLLPFLCAGALFDDGAAGNNWVKGFLYICDEPIIHFGYNIRSAFCCISTYRLKLHRRISNNLVCNLPFLPQLFHHANDDDAVAGTSPVCIPDQSRRQSAKRDTSSRPATAPR